MDLLLGKVYAAWRGHDNDALAVYERAVREGPEDFRAYLAKGLYLKERGRKADAERMFLQASAARAAAWAAAWGRAAMATPHVRMHAWAMRYALCTGVVRCMLAWGPRTARRGRGSRHAARRRAFAAAQISRCL